MVLLNRPNDPSPYDGLILVEPSALKNENRYWSNCRRRVGFEFIDTDTSWPNSWRMAFSVPTAGCLILALCLVACTAATTGWQFWDAARRVTLTPGWGCWSTGY